MCAQGAATAMTMPGNPSSPKRFMLCQITLSNWRNRFREGKRSAYSSRVYLTLNLGFFHYSNMLFRYSFCGEQGWVGGSWFSILNKSSWAVFSRAIKSQQTMIWQTCWGNLFYTKNPTYHGAATQRYPNLWQGHGSERHHKVKILYVKIAYNI